MSSETPAAPAPERTDSDVEVRSASRWITPLLTALLVAAAVLIVSFAAAVAGLV